MPDARGMGLPAFAIPFAFSLTLSGHPRVDAREVSVPLLTHTRTYLSRCLAV